MIDGRNVFDKLVRNNLKTCENFKKLAIVKGDDYMTDCFLDYPFFK